MRKRLFVRLTVALFVIATLAPARLATASPAPGATAATQAQLQTTFFFAEGSTFEPFDTWILLFNPNSTQAIATLTFLSNGVAATRRVTIPPTARESIFVNQFLPDTNFGTRIDSNLPIAAERAMYFRQDGNVVKGVASPSTTWLFGEGATAFPHQTWFLLLNPSSTVTANAVLTFFVEGGAPRTFTLPVPPQSRRSIFANQILPPAAFSTRITSDAPIVAERSMFLANAGGGHASEGAVTGADAWFFAEGSTNQPFDTWFLIFNPNPQPVRILMRFFLQRGGPGPLLDFTIPASSRFSLFANRIVPNADFGATIVSEGGSVVAERSMFFQGGAHNTLGAPSLAESWILAEGSTAAPFQEWILMVNPSGQRDANATLTFFLADGRTVTRSFIVGSQGRASVFIDLLLPQTAVSTRVSSDLPIVVERSMYFSQGRGGHNTVGLRQ